MYTNATILAVDDKKENLDIILDILRDFDVIPTTNGQEAIEIANTEEISLVLLDIVMPEIDGYEVCKILKSEPNTKDIPIIFTTAKTDEQSIFEAYKAGASDYVGKPLKRTEVIERVKTQLKLKKTIENLEFLASRDPMTGVYNRRKFFELSKPMFESYNDTLFVGMVDIDFFKKINDSFGHDAGDIVIKSVAQSISESLPQNSIFARIGGEEFVAVCVGESAEQASKLFDDIRMDISALDIEHNGHKIKFTISIGLVQKNNTLSTVDEMLKEADLALYDAKNSGRNKVILRNPLHG